MTGREFVKSRLRHITFGGILFAVGIVGAVIPHLSVMGYTVNGIGLGFIYAAIDDLYDWMKRDESGKEGDE